MACLEARGRGCARFGVPSDGDACANTGDQDETLTTLTHVKGAFLATQAVLRTMVRQKYGRIINVSSLAGVKSR